MDCSCDFEKTCQPNSFSRFIFVVSVTFGILIGRDDVYYMFDRKAVILQFTRNFFSSIGNKDRQYNWHY